MIPDEGDRPEDAATCQTRSMIRLGSVVMGAPDVERAVTFGSQALGYSPVRFPDEGNQFTILVPPGGEGARVALQQSDGPAQEHPRVHLDLVVDTADEQASEVERLIGLGARRVAWDSYSEDPDYVVLADTAGNLFCIVDASHG